MSLHPPIDNKSFQNEKIVQVNAGHSAQEDAGSSGITSWNSLLDRYLMEKRGNLDTSDTVIQTCWFADYLAKRRQTRLGVEAYELFDHKKTVKDPFVASSTDGRCTRTSVYTKGERTYVYTLGNKTLKISRKRPVTFSILTAEENKETRICPNCGSESKTQDCMNGCPFCGTAFRLTDYDFKLSGDSLGVTNFKPQRLLLALGGVISLIIFIYQMLTRADESIILQIIYSLFTGAFLGFLCYLALQIPIGIVFFLRIVRDNRFNDFCKIIRRNDPLLSSEEFSSEIQSRIRSFFLSDEKDNIRFISGIKPGQYSDVADVHIWQYKSINTVPSPDFFIVRANVILDLIRVKEGNLVREKSPFTIDVYRAASAKTELLTDKEVFSCPSCASPLSILDGGHCKFCGTTSDLSRYGWVLGAVKAL